MAMGPHADGHAPCPCREPLRHHVNRNRAALEVEVLDAQREALLQAQPAADTIGQPSLSHPSPRRRIKPSRSPKGHSTIVSSFPRSPGGHSDHFRRDNTFGELC
jgi:hypothetical protein